MRILILSDSFPAFAVGGVIGGAEHSIFDLAYAFHKKKHEVFIITTAREKKLAKEENLSGLKVFQIYANYHSRWRAYLSLCNPQTIGKVKAIMKEVKPDVVLTHNIHYYLSYFCLKLAQKYSKGVFFNARDMMTFHYGKLPAEHYLKHSNYKTHWWDHIKQAKKRYNPFRNIIIRHYLKYADKIFAVSDSLKEALNQNGIQNVEVIYNGINTEDWKENQAEIQNFKDKYNLQNKKVILFGGRLSDELKGGGQIIKAMKDIVKEVPQAVLLVIGKKVGQTQGLLESSQKLGIENHVIFTDHITGDQLKSAYFCSDVVAVPSLYVTTFNRFNMEAMACKKPVVGTCFGAAAKIVVDNKTGFVVNPFDTKLMVEKIIDLLKNPQKAKEFGEAGYLRVQEKFNLEEKADEYLRWFKNHLFVSKKRNKIRIILKLR